MNKIAIVFGGSGYIGINLLFYLIGRKSFDKYYVFDINPLEGFDGEEFRESVEYQNVDVRCNISVKLDNIDENNSWIFNFAAIHREPGHNYQEYFDTNIPGAENVNEFARKTGVKNIFFTSSIAPYGRSLQERTEKSNLYPETAYGISKVLAERIHRQWLAEDNSRRLIIVRPSVIFGPNDPGNVYKMIKALKKGIFILPNGGDVIKSYGYIYGLIDSINFTMEKTNERLIIYNYAENPTVPLKDMVKIAKKELKIQKLTISMPVVFLAFIAFLINQLFGLIGRKTDIHPIRVKKAGFPTNIKPQFLIDNGFKFKYEFQKSLTHWKKVSPEDFK